ncbi:oxamate carbamoyltransferase subunit AllH family protein [Thermomicrobium sp.]
MSIVVQRVASAILPLLTGPDRTLTVVAAYPRAAYTTDGTTWLSVVTPGALLPPDAVQLRTESPLVSLLPAGSQVVVGQGALRLPDGPPLTIDQQARVWQPILRTRWPCQWSRGRLRALLDELTDPPRQDRVLATTIDRSKALLVELVGALADRTSIARQVDRLAGLGPGLTPLGDDLLVGCCLALTLLAARTGEQRWSALRQEIGLRAASRTTARSAAWLQQAARGEFAREFLLVAQALCRGDHPCLPHLIARVMQVGATSGWGVTFGLIATLEGAMPRPA